MVGGQVLWIHSIFISIYFPANTASADVTFERLKDKLESGFDKFLGFLHSERKGSDEAVNSCGGSQTFNHNNNQGSFLCSNITPHDW